MWKWLQQVGVVMVILMGVTLTGCQPNLSATAGVTHLTLWHGVNPPPNRAVLQELVEQFNRSHPMIEVEPLYIGQGDQQMPKILSAVVGQVPPDLLWYAPMITGQLVELDAIRPLDDWFSDSPMADELDPILLDSMRWENHIWSVPFGVNNVGMFYRPSRFAEAGITTLPQSWSELRQVAQMLTQSGDRPQHYGLLLPLGHGEWTVFMWLSFLWSAGGELLSATNQPQLVTPEAIAALQFWQDLVQDGSVLLSQPERGYELDAFLSGKVAMQLTGPWTLRELQQSGVDFGVFPIPVQVQRATAIGGENLFVFKSTPEAEQAAWAFAEYVTSETFQTQWALGTGYLPVNQMARQNQEYQEFVARQPALDVFLDQAKQGRSRPILPGYSRISDSLGRAIEAVLLETEPPQTALETAQNRLQLIFDSR